MIIFVKGVEIIYKIGNNIDVTMCIDTKRPDVFLKRRPLPKLCEKNRMYSLSVLLVLYIYGILSCMKIDINDNIEFCKIYKRVMDCELRLKERFKFALQATYPNQMFYKLVPFLNQKLLGRYKKGPKGKERDILCDLIKSHKTEEEKIHKFVNMAYLYDILNIITSYKTIYQDVKFNKNFYKQKIEFNDIKKYASLLTKLRNTIMHFQIQDYQLKKNDFIDALSFWEQLLICNNCFIHQLPPVRPTIKNIVLQMKQFYPHFDIANDRHLCDIFDDIAYKNGLTIDKLPKYWSIGRQIYKFK